MTDPPPVRRCEHTKANGEQCRNNAMPDRRFCYINSHCGTAPLETRTRNFFQNNLFWIIPGAIVAVLGGILTLLSYVPQLDVSDAHTVRSRDPMGTIFNLTNNGLPVFGVEQICRMSIVRPNGMPLILVAAASRWPRLDTLSTGRPRALTAIIRP